MLAPNVSLFSTLRRAFFRSCRRSAHPHTVTTMRRPPVPPSRIASSSGIAVAAALLALASCTDRGIQPLITIDPAIPTGTMAVLTCHASIVDGTAECFASDAGPSLAPGVSPDLRTIGGQGTFVRLVSSNVAVGEGTFSMDVTAQNLSNLAMATADGATPHANGVRVFFHAGPNASPGGTVAVSNPTGTAMFTGPAQPYFEYTGTELGADGILETGEVSSAKNWQFSVIDGATSFSFTVYVSTEVPPGAIETRAPQVTSTSVATLVPGATVTLTGINFDPTPANNVVLIGGTVATVTSASATQLGVVVPCIRSGTVGVQVERAGMKGVPLGRSLLVNQRSLGVGGAVVVTTAAEVPCNELPATGVATRYLVAVYSANTSTAANSPFQLAADGLVQSDAVQAPQAPSPNLSVPAFTAAQRAQIEAEDAHYRILEENGRQYERLFNRFRGDARMLPSRNVVAADPVEPPVTRTFRVSNLSPPAGQNICSSYYVVAATRVYYNGKIAIYEDDATPSAFRSSVSATMASNYQRMGDQFNADMEPIIRNNFGDVLRRDAITANNGVVVALFTPHINNNVPGVAGFVVSCDQFPNDDANNPGVGGPYTASAGAAGNGASNFGEFFYAYQPVVDASGFSGNTPENWYRTIRSTFIHEVKHVASQAARVANGSPVWEQAWLEEGTARHSEELWMRNAVDNQAWKSNIPYGTLANPINVYCDVRPGFAQCDANTRRPASIMQRHFTSLYTMLFGQNARLLSPFGPTASDNASYFYAISWSLVRYAVDQYGTSDADFLTALTQSTTAGPANLSARAGVPIDQLLGGWALSLVADDYPGLATPSALTQMPTWNFRSIYAGLNTDLPATYTRVYPQVPTQFTFGSFSAPAIATLRGGGILWYEISGTQAQAQLLRLTGTGGGALPSDVRVAIARVQ
jgi:hypothetical protein